MDSIYADTVLGCVKHSRQNLGKAKLGNGLIGGSGSSLSKGSEDKGISWFGYVLYCRGTGDRSGFWQTQTQEPCPCLLGWQVAWVVVSS